MATDITEGLEKYDLNPDINGLVTLTTALIDWGKRARSGGIVDVQKTTFESIRKLFESWDQAGADGAPKLGVTLEDADKFVDCVTKLNKEIKKETQHLLHTGLLTLKTNAENFKQAMHSLVL